MQEYCYQESFMGVLTHYVKQDFTVRSRTASVDTEETNYTIPWATLTGAGFANGDQVAIIVTVRQGSSNVAGNSIFNIKIGSTFAGAVECPGGYQRIESALNSTDSGHAYLLVDDYTLVTNDNIYFSSYTTSTYTNRVDDFTCIVFKTADLTSTNYKYAEWAGDVAATVTEADGVSVTLGSGDWLILAAMKWEDDSISANAFMGIKVGGVEVQRVSLQGEDTADIFHTGAMVYAPGVAADTIAKSTYWVSADGTHDVTNIKIMAIRLDAFRNYWGVHSTNTVTHSVLDTYSEVAGNGAYTPDVTGANLALCFPKHVYGQATHAPYGRIQVGGADWPSAGVGRTSVIVNGPATAHQAPMLAGYGSLTATTAYDFDFDAAEDADISPTYNCTQQDAVIFSLELATAGVEVLADLASLTLTTYDAVISTSVNVLADSATLSLTIYNASVSVVVNVLADSASLIITTYNASVNAAVNVLTSLASLILATYNATISNSINVLVSTKSLTTTVYNATVNASHNIQSSYIAKILSTYQSIINAANNIIASTKSLVIATYDTIINASHNVQVDTVDLNLVDYSATINASHNIQSASVPLTLTTYTVSISVDVNIAALSKALNLITYDASVEVIAPTTQIPTTLVGTTPTPTSLAPTTLFITTEGPTTSPPITIVITTLAPTTLFHSTVPPTTLVPTTHYPACPIADDSIITDEILIQSIIIEALSIDSIINDEVNIYSPVC